MAFLAFDISRVQLLRPRRHTRRMCDVALLFALSRFGLSRSRPQKRAAAL